MPPFISEHVALSPMTTFGIGGNARYFAEVHNDADLLDALRWADLVKVSVVILAGGSNVLIPDAGIDSLVIRIAGTGHSFSGMTLTAHAGCNLNTLITEASRQSLGGWEKLAGIPGTIGGAVRGNAGAFGPEIKDFVTSVRAISRETRTERIFGTAECAFSYRNSFFKQHSEWIITQVVLTLQDADPDLSASLARDTILEREKRHLQNVRAAGSYFMNPVAPADIVALFENEKQVKSRENRVPAGWLIEKAGMKGASVGGAIASLQHPNYIVNQGTATAADVLNLAESIKQAVRTTFTIELKEEAAFLS